VALSDSPFTPSKALARRAEKLLTMFGRLPRASKAEVLDSGICPTLRDAYGAIKCTCRHFPEMARIAASFGFTCKLFAMRSFNAGIDSWPFAALSYFS